MGLYQNELWRNVRTHHGEATEKVANFEIRLSFCYKTYDVYSITIDIRQNIGLNTLGLIAF
jgi:hypothetical protein